MPLNAVERTLVPMRRCHSKALQRNQNVAKLRWTKFLSPIFFFFFEKKGHQHLIHTLKLWRIYVCLPVIVRIWFKCSCVEQAIVPTNQGLPTVTLCVILCRHPKLIQIPETSSVWKSIHTSSGGSFKFNR